MYDPLKCCKYIRALCTTACIIFIGFLIKHSNNREDALLCAMLGFSTALIIATFIFDYMIDCILANYEIKKK